MAQPSRAIGEAWGHAGITTNAIAPGFFPTPITAPVFGDASRTGRLAARTCLGRHGRLEDLEGAAVFPCSPASDEITGEVPFVDGGFTAT